MNTRAFMVSIGGYGGPVLPILARDPQHAGELYAKKWDLTKSMSPRKCYPLRVTDEDGQKHEVLITLGERSEP